MAPFQSDFSQTDQRMEDPTPSASEKRKDTGTSKDGKTKKPKVLEFESLLLSKLPTAEAYERSYMHRDVVTHIIISSTDFIITASQDGFIKFWKKQVDGIEFVIQFRSHLGPITGLTVSADGLLLCSVSVDETLKLYDVANFDMINMIKLPYAAASCLFVPTKASSQPIVACVEGSTVHIYSVTDKFAKPLGTMSGVHHGNIRTLRYNPTYDACVSIDDKGGIEVWTVKDIPSSTVKAIDDDAGSADSQKKNLASFITPPSVSWKLKSETDLYSLQMKKVIGLNVAISPNGEMMAILANDNSIRIFKFKTGKISKIYDESVDKAAQSGKDQLEPMELGRRMTVEKDFAKLSSTRTVHKDANEKSTNWWPYNPSLLFDDSSNFLFYPTLFGIKGRVRSS
eukprot:TRINITY_DN2253_c0_g2_i3.p1 TRINITY_DN2253_c0_g2~~TRINITY_DN2253_c0_g2_i3.p1  ORF type:complete len:398 (-),score=112.50 TRINITY_DN2253_c0_g2_i3:180-1373(-)